MKNQGHHMKTSPTFVNPGSNFYFLETKKKLVPGSLHFLIQPLRDWGKWVAGMTAGGGYIFQEVVLP